MSDPLERPRGLVSVRISLEKKNPNYTEILISRMLLRRAGVAGGHRAPTSPSPGRFSFRVPLARPKASLKLRSDSCEPRPPSALQTPRFFVLWRFGSGQQRLLPRCVGVGELLITVKYAEHKRCRFSHFKAALVAHVHICANIATPPSPELFHPPNLNPPPVRL